MRGRLLVAVAGRVAARSPPLPRRRRRRSSRSAGSRTRRRSARSSTRTRRATGSGRSTTTCSSTSARTTSRPAPGIAESWDVSRRQEDHHLPPRRGRQVVRRAADHEQGRQVQPRGARRQRPAVHQLHRERHLDRDARRATVVVKTKKPDARIVGGLFIYILPEHIWGKVRSRRSWRNYRPQIPMVGSGPYIVTEFDSNRIVRMERNPNWRGAEAGVRRAPVDQVRQRRRRRARAHARRGRHRCPRCRRRPSSGSARREHQDREGAVAVVHRAGVQPVPARATARTRSTTRPSRTATVRQAIGFAVDRERINEIATRNTSFPGHGLLPIVLQGLLHGARGRRLPVRRRPRAARCSTRRAGSPGDGGVREKGGQRLSFDLFVRSESQVRTSRPRGW